MAKKLGTFIFLSLIFLNVSNLYAQTIRYIDDAGNILWVDRIEDVPMRYRSQVVKPTPVVEGGAESKEYREYLKEQKRKELEKAREEKKKQKELELAKKKREKEIKKRMKEEEKRREKEERKAKKREEAGMSNRPVVVEPLKPRGRPVEDNVNKDGPTGQAPSVKQAQ